MTITTDDMPFKGITVVYGRVEMDISADGTIEGLYIDDQQVINEDDIAAGALE